jgi:hypothetical protein
MIVYVVLFWLGSFLGYALAAILFSSKASDFEASRFYVLRELLRVIDRADSVLCSENDHNRESLQSLRNNVQRVYNEIKDLG